MAILEACILDVGVTGQIAFAFDAAWVERLRSASGDVTIGRKQAGAPASSTFSGHTGQKVFIEVFATNIPDRCDVFKLLGPQDKEVAGGCILNGHGVIEATTLPVAGQYRSC